MTDVAPFRERPKLLRCPRCGEALEEAFDAVLTCLSCEGSWIPVTILEKAFGNRRWPAGSSIWWRNSLECPECAVKGTPQMMTAVHVGDDIVDRCDSHGVWFDRSELARLLGHSARAAVGESADLAALRAELDGKHVDMKDLARRRQARRADIEARRKAAEEYQSWLSAQSEQREREDREARERETREHQRREREERETRERQRREREEQEREDLERQRREHERGDRENLDRHQALDRLESSRAEFSGHLDRVHTRIVTLRERLHATEAELRAAGGDLDRIRAHMREIEDQLAALRSTGG